MLHYSLILFALVIGRISAVQLDSLMPVALRDRQRFLKTAATDDCSTITVTIESRTDLPNLHIPDDCLGYETDGDPVCDGEAFPMECTFNLKLVADSTLLSMASQSAQSFNKSFISEEARIWSLNGGSRPRSDGEMETWASKAIAKSMLVGDSCKPATVGKPAARNFDCDMCWAGFFPYPCNCNCRGWNQVANLCFQPCHVRGRYSFDSGVYCHVPCDATGMIELTTGCGLGHDRVCVKDSGSCALRWVSRVVDLVEVLMNLFPGGGTALKTAGKAAKEAAKTGGKMAAYTAAKAAIKNQAKEAADRVKNMKFITDAFNDYGTSRKDAILETGATKFLTANLPPTDAGDIALEIAKLADPTGVVTLVAGWIPPEGCDPTALCSLDNCPKEG